MLRPDRPLKEIPRLQYREARDDELDDAARRFLQKDSRQEIRVLEGQRANAEKQQRIYEEVMLQDALAFGQSLISYLMGHTELRPAQVAYGAALGLFNLREEFPDGKEMFDQVTLMAAEDLELPPAEMDNAAEATVMTSPLSTDELYAARKLAEKFTSYVTSIKKSMGINNTQATYGMGHAFYTIRGTFPAVEGGTAAFDTLSQDAGAYFERYK